MNATLAAAALAISHETVVRVIVFLITVGVLERRFWRISTIYTMSRMPQGNVQSMFTALVVAGVACGSVVGCGGSSSNDTGTAASTTRPATSTQRMLDTKKVARAITRSVRNQRHTKATVVCPPKVRQAKGVNFVCRVTSRFGVTEFAVVQRDAAGRVSYAAADGAR